MKQGNNDKFIRATKSAAVLKIYKAPRLTSYGDVTLVTKALGRGRGQDGTYRPGKSHSV